MNDFGEELAHWMQVRDMGVRELARRTGYSHSHISELRMGRKRPSPEAAQDLDDALEAGGALVALVNRRTVLAGAVAGLATLHPGALDRLAWARRHPRQIDQAVINSLSDVLAAQRRAEDSLGPRAVMKPVLTQLAEIEELVRQARGPVRPALVDVAQQWAQYGAYLHRDVGNPLGDRALLLQALEWAGEVGDQTMTATVFVQRGNMALAAGEIGATIGLAQAAQRDKTVAVGKRAQGADLEARAYAHAGDVAAAERKLGEAAGLASCLDRAQDPRPWLYYMTPEFFEAERGATLSLLADDPRFQARAIEALQSGYSHLPEYQRSSAWAARNLVHLADVHVRAGDAEQALTVAIQCARIARLTGSVRLRVMLAQLHDKVATRWPGRAGVSIRSPH